MDRTGRTHESGPRHRVPLSPRALEILNEVKKVGPDLNGHRLLLRVNPDIARALKEEVQGVLKDLKQSIGKEVTVRADVQLHHEQFDVMAV